MLRPRLGRHSYRVGLIAIFAAVFAVPPCIQAQDVSTAKPADSAKEANATKQKRIVEGRYRRKGKPTDFIELKADRKATIVQDGTRIDGTYTVSGDTLTLRSPRLAVPALATFTSDNIVVDGDGITWEKEPILSNDDIVKLAAVGLGDEIVIAKIRNATQVKFDLTTDALLALQKSKVSSVVIAAMIDRAAKPDVPDAPQASVTRPNADTSAATPPSASSPPNPCANVELMGLFKNDMRPVTPVIMYFAKIRNGTSVARIVRVEWLDMYGQEMQSTVQIQAGQISTLQLAVQEPFQRQPINLRLASCQ